MNPTLVFFLVLLVTMAIYSFSEYKRRVAFEERFPPISDAEFLARCSPGTDHGVALKVRRILSDIYGVEYERVYPSSRLVDDPEAW